jgi:hypothetical protein
MRKRCPFCFERTGSTGSRENVAINFDTGTFKCFRCDKFGYLTPNNAEKLGVQATHGPGKRYRRPADRGEFILPDWFAPLYPVSEAAQSIVLRRYLVYLLKDRRLSTGALEALTLGVCVGDAVPYALWGGIAFPSHDPRNPGLYVRSEKSGYRAYGLSTRSALYDGRVLDQNDDGVLYVVEGTIDRAAIWPLKAVATYGKDVSENQLVRIAKYCGPVVLCFDGDAWETSKVTAHRLALRGHHHVSWLRLPPNKDPGDLGKSGVESLTATCVA